MATKDSQRQKGFFDVIDIALALYRFASSFSFTLCFCLFFLIFITGPCIVRRLFVFPSQIAVESYVFLVIWLSIFMGQTPTSTPPTPTKMIILR